ncbi:MAG: type IV-A pilus assembly ATPase PilB [Deltaproteobacteria bacterium]|nr:type IV-A pilus assembly ATPase PilB [Deltaproteobacteria bacterium]NIS76384.1 type IV-A pilus assembly ATPase PilB [Deltaproteobacteria bacterium]
MSVLSLKIGEMLRKVDLITQEQLKSALEEQKKSKERLGTVLVKLGYISEEEFLAFLGQQFNIPVVDLSQYDVNSDLVRLLPEDLMQKNLAFPINRVGSKLIVAVADPTNMAIVDAIAFKTGYAVELVLASENSLQELVNTHIEQSSELDEIIIDLDDEFELIQEEEEIDVQEIQKTVEDAPVVKLVNFVLTDAVKKRASDIHIEPYEREFRVRYRIDGVLYEVLKPPFRLKNAIVSRIKILSNLDIAERRLPQDGRIKLKLGKKKEMDYRVSVMPTLHGEKIVLRLLDKSSLEVEMTNLGFEKKQLEEFKEAIYRPYGMVLVTGPTGSGKTTTLYSAIAELNKTTDNISTAEDPVEYSFAGINQVQMKEEIGLTFAASLRSFLRQDPDIILVGEVRDYETAEIAIKAALTGHLVLSTLHTNDAPSTVSRLLNMGIEPFLVSSSLNLILAQRLARRICENCKEEVKMNPKVLLDAGAKKEMLDGFKLYKGKGCEQCSNIGYKGRVALYEVMTVRDEIKEMILRGGSAIELKKEALRFGMKTLRQAGLGKVRDGVTTLEEVLRVSAKD